MFFSDGSMTDEEVCQIAAGIPLFAAGGADAVHDVLLRLDAQGRSYARNEFLLRCGDLVHRFGLLLKGTLRVEQEDAWGDRSLVRRLPSGQIFAETFALLPNVPLTVNVRADVSCRVLWLDADRLLIPGHTGGDGQDDERVHGMLWALLQDLAAKNRLLSEKITHMSHRTTRRKLISFLSAQAQQAGSDTFTIPFDRQQLADYLGVERSAMSAQISGLVKDGIIQCSRSKFTLCKKAEEK